ncbi:MAG: hypothetical protein JOY61_01375 [Chloroflexi bacterium]|nr:hypothetical protein [Chloroflexota bacterium]
MTFIATAVRWLPSVLVLASLLIGPLQPSNDLRLRELTSTASFKLLDLETINVGARVGQLWRGVTGVVPASDADKHVLQAYFAQGSAREDLRPQAERALEDEVAQAYRDAGVTHSQPVGIAPLFPPVLVALTPPPNVLVISPRNDIRVISSMVLRSMDVASEERLEDSADSTGVSSLVAPIGGLATYPAMVLEEGSSDRVLSSVAHEWLHQYLIFYPLGAGYWTSEETREINETTADMVGNEVGSSLAKQLDLIQPGAPVPPQQQSSFDFGAFMRETRQSVDVMLSAGQIDAAEAYMNARRDELQRHGYAVRKLNQAYFALYGSYAEGYAASPANPIPGLLRQLRARGSLADFLFAVRDVTTVAQLRALVATTA